MAKLRIIARIGQEDFMFVGDVVFVVVVEWCLVSASWRLVRGWHGFYR